MTKNGQYRVLVYCFLFFVVLWFVYAFFDNAAQASYTPKYKWKNHVYSNGAVTVNGTMTVQPHVTKTPKNTTIKTAPKTVKKGAEDCDTDDVPCSTKKPSKTAVQPVSSGSDETRTGRDKLGPYYPTPYQGKSTAITVHAPMVDSKVPWLAVEVENGETSTFCTLEACIVNVTPLEHGVYVVINVGSDTYNVLVVKNGDTGTYSVSSSNVYRLVISENSYTVFLY